MSVSRTPSETRTPRMEPLARLPVFFGLTVVLPVLGHAMYVPEIRTNGAEVRIRVVD